MVTPNVTVHSFREAARVGQTLADSVTNGMADEVLLRDDRLISLRRRVQLAVDNPLFKKLALMGVIHRSLSDSIETEVGVLKIGSVIETTVPGEALPRIGFALKKAVNSEYAMTFGLANDEVGYLIPGKDWREDEYEESMSLGRTAGDDVTRHLVELIGRL